jgi:hypothetical protein
MHIQMHIQMPKAARCHRLPTVAGEIVAARSRPASRRQMAVRAVIRRQRQAKACHGLASTRCPPFGHSAIGSLHLPVRYAMPRLFDASHRPYYLTTQDSHCRGCRAAPARRTRRPSPTCMLVPVHASALPLLLTRRRRYDFAPWGFAPALLGPPLNLLSTPPVRANPHCGDQTIARPHTQ